MANSKNGAEEILKTGVNLVLFQSGSDGKFLELNNI